MTRFEAGGDWESFYAIEGIVNPPAIQWDLLRALDMRFTRASRVRGKNFFRMDCWILLRMSFPRRGRRSVLFSPIDSIGAIDGVRRSRRGSTVCSWL